MSEPDAGSKTGGTTGSGFGRVLVFVYGIFAAAATARSLVQLATKASDAPLAYSLSAFAGVVYCLATWAIAKNRRRLALTTVLVELVGVLAVGTWSVLAPGDFPDQTVWSDFGQGYGYVPALLPFVGLWWLLSRPRSDRAAPPISPPAG